MWKSIIQHLPGTGGCLLQRVLTLSPHTLCGTGGADPKEYLHSRSLEDRMALALQWHTEHWKQHERLTQYGIYAQGTPWERYRDCALWFIDRMHPLWSLSTMAQRLTTHRPESWIRITVRPEDQAFLEANQAAKGYHIYWQGEIEAMAELTDRMAGIPRWDIPFHSLFDWHPFLAGCEQIDRALGLELPWPQVHRVWQAWHSASSRTWQGAPPVTCKTVS